MAKERTREIKRRRHRREQVVKAKRKAAMAAKK
jgi:hypothetical protein